MIAATLRTSYHSPTDPLTFFATSRQVGDDSTEDEYGTALYKLVELDQIHLGSASNVRKHVETMGHETPRFLDYFGGSVRYLSGGIESGVGITVPSVSSPHLYRVKVTFDP